MFLAWIINEANIFIGCNQTGWWNEKTCRHRGSDGGTDGGILIVVRWGELLIESDGKEWQKKVKDTQRETEKTSAVLWASWWEETGTSKSIQAQCTLSMLVCGDICVSVYQRWRAGAAAAWATAAWAISGEETEEMRWKEQEVWEKEEEKERFVPMERLWEHGEKGRKGMRWQEEGLRAEQGGSCWGKQYCPVGWSLGTDCDGKEQTVSNTSGTCCFSIGHFPRHWSQNKQVVQTKHTNSICLTVFFPISTDKFCTIQNRQCSLPNGTRWNSWDES